MINIKRESQEKIININTLMAMICTPISVRKEYPFFCFLIINCSAEVIFVSSHVVPSGRHVYA